MIPAILSPSRISVSSCPNRSGVRPVAIRGPPENRLTASQTDRKNLPDATFESCAGLSLHAVIQLFVWFRAVVFNLLILFCGFGEFLLRIQFACRHCAFTFLELTFNFDLID